MYINIDSSGDYDLLIPPVVKCPLGRSLFTLVLTVTRFRVPWRSDCDGDKAKKL